MSKYQPLWEHIQTINADKLSLSYGEIESILGFPIDHSFLTYKKELPACGWNVKKNFHERTDCAFRKET